MENIKLILSDLDGTLFHNDKSISDFSKKMIASAQKQGILFGISTSRALVNASKFLDGIKPDVIISNGGGMVICPHADCPVGSEPSAKIYSCEFTPEEARTIISTAFKVMGPDATLSLDNEQGLYSNSREELGDTFWTFNDFSDFRAPAMKICLQTLDREKVEQIASSVGLENVDYLPFSDIPWYKLSKKGATKDKGIEALCAHLKITPQEIVAFGDDFNDI